MPPHPDVLILGGGVIGLTTAYFLAKEKAAVTVVDKGDLGQESSWAGAGIISPGNPRRARTPLGQLKARSAAMFADFSAELREQSGIDNGYRKCGGIELRRSSNELEKKQIESLLQEERGEGVDCAVLDSEQLLKLEPALAPDLPGGVHFPDTAQVRNPRHLRALIAACQKLNVRLLPHHAVQHVEHHGGRVTGIVTPVGRLAAHRYLVAAGSWSDEILRMVGLRSGIRPVRGQIVLLQTPSPLFTHILLAGSEYLVPRDDGRVLAGSTEEEVGYDKRTTADAVLHLLALATRLVPALAAAQVERCWAGLRPGNPDGKPFLGSVPGFDNLILAAGHFRTGIHLSPITGLLMKELLLGQPPSLPLDAFRLDRLQH